MGIVLDLFLFAALRVMDWCGDRFESCDFDSYRVATILLAAKKSMPYIAWL